jgi:hypothetical protein
MCTETLATILSCYNPLATIPGHELYGACVQSGHMHHTGHDCGMHVYNPGICTIPGMNCTVHVYNPRICTVHGAGPTGAQLVLAQLVLAQLAIEVRREEPAFSLFLYLLSVYIRYERRPNTWHDRTLCSFSTWNGLYPIPTWQLQRQKAVSARSLTHLFDLAGKDAPFPPP